MIYRVDCERGDRRAVVRTLQSDILGGLAVGKVEALKELYRVWQPRWRSHKLSDVIWSAGKKAPDEKQVLEFIEDASQESTFEFVKRQYYHQVKP